MTRSTTRHWRAWLCGLGLLLGLSTAATAQVLGTAQVTAVSSGGDCVTTAGSCASFQLGPSPSYTFQVVGTFSGTLTFEGTADGATWTTITLVKVSDASSVTTTTATGQFAGTNWGLLQVRARATSWASGTAVVTLTRGMSSQAAARSPGSAPSNATFLLQTANASLPSAQAMGALATGLVYNTTTTGVQSAIVCGTAGTVLAGGAPPTCTASPTLTSIAVGDGLVGAPALAFTNATSTGIYRASGNTMSVTAGGSEVGGFQNGNVLGLVLNYSNGAVLGWGTAGTSAPDVQLARDAAGILALKNGVNAQAFRPYGYSSGARTAYGAVQTATAAVTLSGATSTATAIIPAGAYVIGVATTTTTAITGASGYQVGDGTTATRWGDITGTALGTHSANADATANPTGWFAANGNVVLTAKTSNFTGGVVQVVVYYLTTGSS